MNEHAITDALNDAQRAAVTAPLDHCLILAGAGSGKTRVLIHRIAWLCQVQHLSPHEILSVTFTNKAAGEMRQRLETLLPMASHHLWTGTFHGITHRLLRKHWQEAGLISSFQVLDNEDQGRLIRRILQDLKLHEEEWPLKQVQWFINKQKEEGRRPGQAEHSPDVFHSIHTKIYQRYEEICHTNGLVDFAELLLRSYELWHTHPDICLQYQQRFKHILVDEFQDTNVIQYRWLKKIVANSAIKLMTVGDDDQSIYGWRGAEIENIRQFTSDFPTALIFRLEQNYRSTPTILNAANAVIACNSNRFGKNLWTHGAQGEPITLYEAQTDKDEARFIIQHIKQWVKQGGSYQQVAILYRSNMQSRVLEEELLHANIPYTIYGGLKFFERAEIKDVLGYLRFIANPDDNPAFERIINTPTRGIGETTLSTLRLSAQAHTCSLWGATQKAIQGNALPNRALSALVKFTLLIQELMRASKEMTLPKLTEHVLIHSGLMVHYQKDLTEKGRGRIENLEELITTTSQFKPSLEAEGISPLTEFLSHVTLEAGEQATQTTEQAVQLMTLHSAKGLEFPVVYMTGMEEGLFPHILSTQKPGQLEEERRLCYVGMTRAMKKLYLTHAHSRYLKGQEKKQRPSRFLQEIPSEYLESVKVKVSVNRPSFSLNRSSAEMKSALPVRHEDGFNPGVQVFHELFGEGVILSREGQGAHTRLHVKFRAGEKWLIMAYANLILKK